MLEKDPSKRIDISQIFEHPWIMKYREGNRFNGWGQMSSSSNESVINTESECKSPEFSLRNDNEQD